MMSFIRKQQPLFYLIQKNFRQVFRDPQILRIIFVIPVVQLLILSNAATTDLRNIRLGVLDADHSNESRQLAESFFQNDIFVRAETPANSEELNRLLFAGKIDAGVWIPRGYAEALSTGETAAVSLTVDGQNSSVAGRSLGYLQGVIQSELQDRFEILKMERPEIARKLHQIEPVVRYFYNPTLESKYYMVPAILVMLITLVSVMITGAAIVREKEVGTLEQILVTPLTSRQIIAGMTIPYAILSAMVFTVGVLIAVLVFRVPLLGSIPLLYICAGIYMLTTMGGGLLVSTTSSTQQQALFTTWFFMIFFIMTSGFFYPVDNMPEFVRAISVINPMRYLMAIIRGIFLRGSTLADVWPNLWPLIVMGVTVFSIAVLRFRKRLS
ncbi:ABC transporter permease [bacterium]|nr:ABC transporter permease [bacterium]